MASSGYRIPKGKYVLPDAQRVAFRHRRDWHGRQGVSVFDVYNRRTAHKSKEPHARNLLVLEEHRAARMFTLGVMLEISWSVWVWERSRIARLVKFKL